MGDVVRDAEDTIRGAADTIFPGVGLIPPEYYPAIAAAAGGALLAPIGLAPVGAVIGGNLGEVKGMSFPS